MNLVDIVLLIPLAFGAVRGFMKGLLKEITGFASVILGVVSAYLFSEPLYQFLKQSFTPGIGLRTACYVIVFALVSFLLFQLGRLLTKIINFMALGIINYFLGGVFGLLKYAFILVVLVYFYTPYEDESPIFQSELIGQSMMYHRLKKYSPVVESILGEAASLSFDLDPAQLVPGESNTDTADSTTTK